MSNAKWVAARLVGGARVNVISVLDLDTLSVVKDLTIGGGRVGHIAFTKDVRYGYVSNDKDGARYKIDMEKLEVSRRSTPTAAPEAARC